MSKPVIARDLQRIVAFIPFHSDRLDEVIDRAWWWADEIFVRDYPESKVDAMVFGDPYAHEIDLDSIEEAWLECEQKTHLKEGDYLAFLWPDEVIVDPQVIKTAIRHNWGRSIGATVIALQDEENYRLDHRSDLTVWPFVPYKPQGRFFTFSYRMRGPAYVMELDRVEIAAATILTYQFSTEPKREYWAHELEDPGLIINVPTKKWTGGGTL